MIRLKEFKKYTENKPSAKTPLSKNLFIPLTQHLGKPAQAIVKAGDMVLCGQKIAQAQGEFSANIHASASGKVIAIKNHPHPNLCAVPTVVLEPDGKDQLVPGILEQEKPQEEMNNLVPEEIKKAVFENGIVGMGGASFPTHIKLNPQKKIEYLILNGVECEPYLTCDYRLMLERPLEIIKGLKLIEKTVSPEKTIVAIEDNKPGAIKIFKDFLKETSIGVRVLKTRYPQGGEKQLIQAVTKREVPSGKLPFDVGCLVQNVGTAFAIYEAVYKNRPLFKRIVTVGGDCIKNPKNLWVRVGTPIQDLINVCGGFSKEPKKIVVGGPMMGIAQYDLQIPAIKSTSGVLALSKYLSPPSQESMCLRCGECVEYCPMGLLPGMISLALEKNRLDLAEEYGVLDCMECGLCAYICPAKRNLVQAIKSAKLKIASVDYTGKKTQITQK